MILTDQQFPIVEGRRELQEDKGFFQRARIPYPHPNILVDHHGSSQTGGDALMEN